VPCHDGAFRDPNLATNSHCITFDPSLRPEFEVGSKNDDITGNWPINSEVGENCCPTGGCLSHPRKRQNE
jgi:hypothetical protein